MKSLLTVVKSMLAVAGVAALSAVSAAPASAIGFGFNNIAGGDTGGDQYVSQLSFDVTDGGSNNVLFKIANNTSVASIFIGSVFFDTGSNSNLLSNFAVNVGNSAGVLFKDTNAKTLPQKGNLNDWSTDFSASQDGGNNGVSKGQKLGVSFTGNYANVVSALNDGTLRLGLHLQGLPTNPSSDSFLNSTSGTSNTQATPEPLTMLAAGAAVSFGAMFKKQRAQAQKAQ